MNFVYIFHEEAIVSILVKTKLNCTNIRAQQRLKGNRKGLVPMEFKEDNLKGRGEGIKK